MPNFITQPELDEMNALANRWESLNTAELQRLLYLCQLTQRHVTNVVEIWEGADSENLIGGLEQVIEKIQGRLV